MTGGHAQRRSSLWSRCRATIDELQRELDTLAAQLEKDVATLKLKYAKRKQHLESVVRGKASYAAQGGQ